jgi:hypothetical protein
MQHEMELSHETPQQLRNRAGRYRQYACYYYNDPAHQGLDELASTLETRAAELERLLRLADATA